MQYVDLKCTATEGGERASMLGRQADQGDGEQRAYSERGELLQHSHKKAMLIRVVTIDHGKEPLVRIGVDHAYGGNRESDRNCARYPSPVANAQDVLRF